jgi:hypothetical protein
MNHQSTEITRIVQALIKARKAIPVIGKDKQGQFKYASLEEILQVIIPVLLENEILLSQVLEQTNDNMMVITKLFHSSGQWIQSTVSVNHPSIFKPEGQRRAAVQELGSNITYMKRYSIAAILGLIIAEEDVDDHSHALNIQRTITDKQLGLLKMKLREKPQLEIMIVNKLGIDDISEIPLAKFNDILKWIDNQ